MSCCLGAFPQLHTTYFFTLRLLILRCTQTCL